MSVLLTAAIAALAWGQGSDNASKVKQNLDQATSVIQDMTTTAPDKGIPNSVLQDAKCIAVIPKMVKGAFVIGGEHGAGFATCRTANGWSAPAPFSVSGISWGVQIGGESSAIIMMVMNEQGMRQLISGHLKVGADASVAAGPVGREGSASAGWKAAILTYSRSKGAFAGISLSGAEIQQDDKATRELYGKDVSFQQILAGNTPTPAVAKDFVNAVSQAKVSAASE
jgi:lipid-binding SYLF domain-containing protein